MTEGKEQVNKTIIVNNGAAPMVKVSINPSVFTLSADGSLTVERFDCIVTRGMNEVSNPRGQTLTGAMLYGRDGGIIGAKGR